MFLPEFPVISALILFLQAVEMPPLCRSPETGPTMPVPTTPSLVWVAVFTQIREEPPSQTAGARKNGAGRTARSGLATASPSGDSPRAHPGQPEPEATPYQPSSRSLSLR